MTEADAIATQTAMLDARLSSLIAQSPTRTQVDELGYAVGYVGLMPTLTIFVACMLVYRIFMAIVRKMGIA